MNPVTFLALFGILVAFIILAVSALVDGRWKQPNRDDQDLKDMEMELHIKAFDRKNKGVHHG